MKAIFLMAALALVATPALAAQFQTQLDPAPIDASNKALLIGGIGAVTATLDGKALTISGEFSGFSAPATGGSVRIGLAKGVPGDAIGDLTVDHALAGRFSGTITLNPAQVDALRKQALYIRIDSEQAPDGAVQGWLEGAD